MRVRRIALWALFFGYCAAGGSLSSAHRSLARAADLEPVRVAQTEDDTEDDEEVEEEDVPIPPNLLEPEPGPPDTTRAPSALPDTSRAGKALADSAKAFRAEPPETLHAAPPLGAPGTVMPGGAGAKKPKSGGIWGVTPGVILLGLAALHIFVVRTVGD